MGWEGGGGARKENQEVTVACRSGLPTVPGGKEQRKNTCPRGRQTWVQAPALPLTGRVNQGKPLSHSTPFVPLSRILEVSG